MQDAAFKINVIPDEAERFVAAEAEASHQLDGDRAGIAALLHRTKETTNIVERHVLRPRRWHPGLWHAGHGALVEQLVVHRVSERSREQRVAVPDGVWLPTSGLLLIASVLDHGQPILDEAGGELRQEDVLKLDEVEAIEAQVRAEGARRHPVAPGGEPGAEPLADADLVGGVSELCASCHEHPTVEGDVFSSNVIEVR